MKELVLIGAGGHSRSIIEAVESQDVYKIIGILDQNLPNGTSIFNYPILGNDELIEELVNKGAHFHLAIGQISDSTLRAKLFHEVKKKGGQFASVVASTARVSKHSILGEGVAILHFAFVNAGAKIGDNTIINSAALIEHDVTIGNNCHISTGAIINGSAKVGDDCFIGSNTVVNHQLEIGRKSVVASGSLVTKSLAGGKIYKGNPVIL